MFSRKYQTVAEVTNRTLLNTKKRDHRNLKGIVHPKMKIPHDLVTLKPCAYDILLSDNQSEIKKCPLPSSITALNGFISPSNAYIHDKSAPKVLHTAPGEAISF